jgi:D-sedoheptulose 7-phosphate isomerase
VDFLQYFEHELDDHKTTLSATRERLGPSFAEMLEIWTSAIGAGGKILFFGNGGSAADAQHLAAELVVRFIDDRRPIPAIALTTDTSALTAGGNDLGFEHIFARQIEALGRKGDVAVGLSTSGNSANVLKALETARDMELHACGLAGRDGGGMRNLAAPLLIVPATSTRRIQEMHITLGHMLCGGLELALGLVERHDD